MASNHVGPVIFADETARRRLEGHGNVVTFRTSERTTGDTWWRASRTGEKKGDCTIEHIHAVHPSKADALKPYRIDSGFRSIPEWQNAIENLNGELEPGHLYRVTSDELWAECENCHEYSPDVEAVGHPNDFVYRCPDCRSFPEDTPQTEEA